MRGTTGDAAAAGGRFRLTWYRRVLRPGRWARLGRTDGGAEHDGARPLKRSQEISHRRHDHHRHADREADGSSWRGGATH